MFPPCSALRESHTGNEASKLKWSVLSDSPMTLSWMGLVVMLLMELEARQMYTALSACMEEVMVSVPSPVPVGGRE